MWENKKLPKKGVPIKNDYNFYKYRVTHLDGSVEVLFAHIYTHDGKFYLDPFTGGYADWAARFNQWEERPGNATCHFDIKNMIGHDRFMEWKKWWATNNLSQIQRDYELQRNFDIKNIYEELGLPIQKPDKSGKFPKWREATKPIDKSKRKTL